MGPPAGTLSPQRERSSPARPGPGRWRAAWRQARHLGGRFGGSLLPHGPPPAAEAWVGALLSPAEQGLWRRMSGPDRRHAVAVAHRVLTGPPGVEAGPAQGTGAGAPGHGPAPPPRAILAAALLHDVGKVEADLGTLARVGATMATLALGRARVGGWAERAGLGGRVGRYVVHDRLGASLLASAGSHPLVVSWAAEHHLAPRAWQVPPAAGARLKAADDD